MSALRKKIPGRTDPAILRKAELLGLNKEKTEKIEGYPKHVKKRIQEIKQREGALHVNWIKTSNKRAKPREGRTKTTVRTVDKEFEELEQYIFDWGEKNHTDIIDLQAIYDNRLYADRDYFSKAALYKGLKHLEEKNLAKQINSNKFIIYPVKKANN